MTTYDPDTQVQDASVLRDIVNRFEGKLALNARVLRGGMLRVGDEAALDAGGPGYTLSS
jgi:MOSC domain-containing protein YiiM